MHDIQAEWKEIEEHIPTESVKQLTDIGCGHAIIDYFIHSSLGCDITLVDIETSTERHHSYRDSGAGYASLDAAKRLLVSNGISEDRIRTLNPTQSNVSGIETDLTISLLSCGFHYPLSTYDKFFKRELRPGSVVVCDIRKNTGQDNYFSDFSKVQLIHETKKYSRVAATK